MFEYGLGVGATAVFAVTGVLAAAEKKADLFGVLVLGVVTAVGGGTLRDTMLAVDVFWIRDPTFLWVAAGAAVAGFFFTATFRATHRQLLYLDAFGAALFGVQGTHKALSLGHGFGVAAVVGVLTAIGGGLIRDLLSGRTTLLMTHELYATPILLGSLLYASLYRLSPFTTANEVVALTFVFVFRAAAIRRGWSMPGWAVSRSG